MKGWLEIKIRERIRVLISSIFSFLSFSEILEEYENNGEILTFYILFYILPDLVLSSAAIIDNYFCKMK